MNCNNGCFGNNSWWIIILILRLRQRLRQFLRLRLRHQQQQLLRLRLLTIPSGEGGGYPSFALFSTWLHQSARF